MSKKFNLNEEYANYVRENESELENIQMEMVA